SPITGIDPPPPRLASPRAAELRQQALDLLRARPAVHAAAWALRRPMSGGFVVNPVVEGREAAPHAKPLDIQANVVTDGYFDALEIPVVAGRAFIPQTPGVVERSA